VIGCKIEDQIWFSMDAIQLVVFDLAGTTVHDKQDVQRVLQSTLANAGVAISMHEAAMVMGIPKPVALRQLLEKHLPDKSVITDSLIDRLHGDFVAAMIRFYVENANVKEMPGASEVFAELLAQGRKVYVDTGFDRAITNALLERLGWKKNGLISGSITSDEVQRGRPFPDMVLKAMELEGVLNPKAVAKVGDTSSDMQQGTSAKCGLVIGVTTGAFTREELEHEPHTHIAVSLHEVLHIIQSQV